MSELKAFTFGLGQYTEDGSPCVVAFDGEKNPRLASDEKFYLKSEADKVIARYKYKRCLAIVSRCFTKSKYHFVLARHGENGKENNRKSILYAKWHKRWLSIAEKFKEEK